MSYTMVNQSLRRKITALSTSYSETAILEKRTPESRKNRLHLRDVISVGLRARKAYMKAKKAGKHRDPKELDAMYDEIVNHVKSLGYNLRKTKNGHVFIFNEPTSSGNLVKLYKS